MKKITLIASLVMACVISQATTVSWGTTAALDSKFAGGTAYLVWNNNTGEVLSYDGDLAKQTSFSSSKILDTILATANVDASGNVSASDSIVPSGSLTKGNKPAYMVIISADGKDMIAMSAAANINIQDSTLNVTFKRNSAGFGSSYTAIPEPTALVLLGLGVAAIGLKRKVA